MEIDYVLMPQYIIKEYRDCKIYREYISDDIDNANKQFDSLTTNNLNPNINYRFVLYDIYNCAKLREYDSITDSCQPTTITD